MAIKKVMVCDGCGKVINKTSEAYHLNLRTDSFWDGVERDYLEENFDFCPLCASDIKRTLERIARMKES